MKCQHCTKLTDLDLGIILKAYVALDPFICRVSPQFRGVR